MTQTRTEAEIRYTSPVLASITEEVYLALVRREQRSKVPIAAGPGTWAIIAALLQAMAGMIAACDFEHTPGSLHRWLTQRPFARFRTRQLRKAVRVNWGGDVDLRNNVALAVDDIAKTLSARTVQRFLHEVCPEVYKWTKN